MTEAVTEAEEILVISYKQMEGIFHSQSDPEVTITQDGHTEDSKIIDIEVTGDNKGIEGSLDHQLEDLDLHEGVPKEMTDVSVVDNLNIFPKPVPRKTTLQEKSRTEEKD